MTRRVWLSIGTAASFFLLGISHLHAQPWIEEHRDGRGNIQIRVVSLDVRQKAGFRRDVPYPPGPYLLLGCRDSVFEISINWREPVGKFGEKYRHLFYHVDGDRHLMLAVVDDLGHTTGYAGQPEKAKALLYEMLSTLKRDFIPVGVFPAGRNPATGKWIDAWFPAMAFSESAQTVGRACGFEPTQSKSDAHSVDKVPPARPGG